MRGIGRSCIAATLYTDNRRANQKFGSLSKHDHHRYPACSAPISALAVGEQRCIAEVNSTLPFATATSPDPRIVIEESAAHGMRQPSARSVLARSDPMFRRSAGIELLEK
jgi:hypothetical protein